MIFSFFLGRFRTPAISSWLGWLKLFGPVLFYDMVRTARRSRYVFIRLLYASLLLANASSLLLPGSNLTNLIVVGHLHLSGAAFAARMEGGSHVPALRVDSNAGESGDEGKHC